MNTAKVAGWVLGMGVLLCGFFLPFWDLTSGAGKPFDTLYGAARFTQSDLASIGQLGLPQVTVLAYLVLVAALVIALSGVLGVFPKVGGALGIVGMLALTLGPSVLFPAAAISLSDFGAGFWVIWGLSFVNLLIGITAGRSPGQEALAAPAPAQSQPPPAPLPV